MMTTKLKLAVVLFSCVFSASISYAQETTPEGKRRDAAKEVRRAIQTESQKGRLPKATTPSWQKLSDQQVARLFFPDGKLFFRDSTEGLVDQYGSIDGAVVHKVKRVVANLDTDPTDEMAVLLVYSTGMCTFCVDNAIFAILGRQDGKVKVRWRTEEIEAFDNDGTADISTMKLIQTDKFFEVAVTYNGTPGGVSSSKKMKIIRWDGKRFSAIWSYELESQDTGGHEGTPHDYLARIDFLDDKKGFKRIKVTSMYATRGRAEEPTQYVLYEEFAWSEKDQRYWSISQHEVRYEKGQEVHIYQRR